MQRGVAGAGGLNGGSPARGGAASTAEGAGGCGGRGRGPGREAEAGTAGTGGPAPKAMMGKEEVKNYLVLKFYFTAYIVR